MTRTVLIVDADAQFLPMLREAFHRVGFEVASTDSRENVVHLARTRRPDLILLNVELPAGNAEGYLVCKDLKSDAELAKIPVILTSRRAREEDFVKHRKLKTRADDYLRKPFTDEDLFQRVENLLGFQISNNEYLALEGKLHEFLEEKSRLEDAIVARDERLAALEAKLAAAEAAKSEPAALAESELAREEAANRHAEAERSADSLRKEINALRGALDEARSAGDTQRVTVEDLRERLSEADRQVMELGGERDTLAAKAAELEAEVGDAVQRADTSASRVAEVETELDDLRELLADAQSRLEAAEAALAAKTEEAAACAALEEERNKLAETLAATENEAEDLRGEVESVRVELEGARDARRAAEQEVTAITKEMGTMRKQMGRIRTALAKALDLLPDENAGSN